MVKTNTNNFYPIFEDNYYVHQYHINFLEGIFFVIYLNIIRHSYNW